MACNLPSPVTMYSTHQIIKYAARSSISAPVKADFARKNTVFELAFFYDFSPGPRKLVDMIIKFETSALLVPLNLTDVTVTCALLLLL